MQQAARECSLARIVRHAHSPGFDLLQRTWFGPHPVAQGLHQARHLVGYLLHEPLCAVAGSFGVRSSLDYKWLR
jgi:hypothetical protein